VRREISRRTKMNFMFERGGARKIGAGQTHAIWASRESWSFGELSTLKMGGGVKSLGQLVKRQKESSGEIRKGSR